MAVDKDLGKGVGLNEDYMKYHVDQITELLIFNPQSSRIIPCNVVGDKI